MPIYGYACTNCGHTLDALQKVADAPLVDCPACKQAGLKRQLSAPRFRLKGKGWYETDFKSDNQRNLAGDKQPDKVDGTSDAGKKDSKDAGKKDSKDADKKDSKKADAKSEQKVQPKKSTNKENTA